MTKGKNIRTNNPSSNMEILFRVFGVLTVFCLLSALFLFAFDLFIIESIYEDYDYITKDIALALIVLFFVFGVVWAAIGSSSKLER